MFKYLKKFQEIVQKANLGELDNLTKKKDLDSQISFMEKADELYPTPLFKEIVKSLRKLK